MTNFLVESGRRVNRPAIVNTMMMGATAKYEEDIKTMAELADESEKSRSMSSEESELTQDAIVQSSESERTARRRKEIF